MGNSPSVCAPGLDYKFKRSYGEIGEGRFDFKCPADIFVDAKLGRMWVVDTNNDRVHVFNHQDEWNTWTNVAFVRAGFRRPASVAVESDEKGPILYVCDSGNSRVAKMRESGELLHTFGSEGEGKAQLMMPHGITLFKNCLYVSDTLNSRIQVYDKDHGTHLASYGNGKGFGANQFDGPGGLVIADDGTMFVADVNNDRIQVLDSGGKFIQTFPKRVSGLRSLLTKSLQFPTQVALDGDRLVVADMANSRIVILDRRDGRQIGTIGSTGEGPGKFINPNGIAIFGSNMVVSSKNKLSFFEDEQLARGVAALKQYLHAEVSWMKGQDCAFPELIVECVDLEDVRPLGGRPSA